MPRPSGIEKILMEVSIATGIRQDKLGKEYDILYTMQELYGLFAKKIILFGGTALNLFYFGDKQRLSYDIDVKTGCIRYVYPALKKQYEELTESQAFYRFETAEGIRIDLAKEYLRKKPQLLKAKSLFDVTGNSIMNVQFYVYPFEVLMAEKILTLSHRGTAKDLYDVWVCLSLDFDRRILHRLLVNLGKRKSIDPRIIAMENYQADIDMGKIDSMLPNLNGNVMLKEVKDFINLLFFKR